MAKQLTAFRLSDRTKDNLQTALELKRLDLIADNLSWQAERTSRTDIVAQAIEYYLSELLKRKTAREWRTRERKPATSRAKR